MSIAETLESQSKTLSKSKFESDARSIDAAGGSDKFIEMNARAAGAKMGALKSSINTADETYKGGYEALESDKAKIMTAQQAGDTQGRKAFLSKEGGIRDFVDKWIANSENPEQLKSELAESGMISLDNKGNYKVNPENFLQARAYLNANNMMSHNALAAAGEIAAGAIGKDGATVHVDSQDSAKGGKKFDGGVEGEIHGDLQGAKAAEAARFAMNPKKWVEGLAAKGERAFVDTLSRMGMSEEEAQDMYRNIASPAAGIADGVAIAEVASRIAGKGSFVGNMWNALPNPFHKTDTDSPSPTNNSNQSSANSGINNNGQHNPTSDVELDQRRAISSSGTGNYNIDMDTPQGKKGFFSNIFDGVTDLFSSNAGKQALRAMPLVGTAAGLVFAGQEAMAGNFERAGLELVSATADMVPGVGTAIGLSADAALMAGVGLPNQNPIANTSRAMAADQGLPAAIDSYNTTQNIQAMDTARTGVAIPMQTRRTKNIEKSQMKVFDNMSTLQYNTS
jgi:hypothetical protein